jgi:RimJ/RimL family protein N-acetyltransferase
MQNRSCWPTFTTERLRLRMLQPGDEGFLAALDSDAEVMRYVHSGALPPETARRWARSQVEMAPYRRHFHKWIVEAGGEGGRVGWIELCKFRGVFDPKEAQGSDDISIGYQFAPAYWKQGLALESAGLVLAYAFQTLKLDRVVAFVRVENERSTRVLEKLGFRAHASRRHSDEGGNECLLYSLIQP